MRSPSHPPGAEAGFSLIEVLISVAIMGIAMVAVIGALATQIKGADLHRNQSNASAVLSSAAEKIQSSGYVACDASPATTYKAAARTATLPSDWVTKGVSVGLAIDVTSVKNWNGSSFVATCAPDATDTLGLLQIQLVTVAVTGPNASGTEQLDIVKRKP